MINKNKIASRNSHGFRMTLLPFDADGSQWTSSDDAIITLLLSARPVTKKEVIQRSCQIGGPDHSRLQILRLLNYYCLNFEFFLSSKQNKKSFC